VLIRHHLLSLMMIVLGGDDVVVTKAANTRTVWIGFFHPSMAKRSLGWVF